MKKYFDFYYNLSIAYFIPNCDSMFMDKNRYYLLHPSLCEGKEVLISLPDLERIYGPYLDAELREDGVVLELASPPGGVDLDAAGRLGRQVISAAGLPGKVAPITAAAAIRDSVYHILEERGEPI